MTGVAHGRSPRDPITGYLDQLRAGLRVAPGEAELILAEAEDHLRETAAAGMAIGMTEREAQQAAISSFGPVRAVVRAHQARQRRVAAVLGDASMAAWKLASLLLVTSGFSGLATMAIFTLSRPILLSYEVYQGGRTWVIMPVTLDFRWLAWSVTALTGVILLAGYGLVRRRQRRRGRTRAPLAGFFPVVAASFFGLMALTLMEHNLSSTGMMSDTGLVIPTCMALAVGYAVRMAWTFCRWSRGRVTVR